MDQALVGIKIVPLSLFPLAGVGQDVDGDAQYVCQAVELALRDVERIERLLRLQELEKLTRVRDGFLCQLASLTLHLHLKYQECSNGPFWDQVERIRESLTWRGKL